MNSIKVSFVIVVTIFALAGAYIGIQRLASPEQFGATGANSRVATSSTIQVGPQQVKTLFTSRPSCSARIIGTVAVPVQVSFRSDIVPTALIGNPVLASTTSIFSSNTVGCDAVTAYAAASTTITISESIW